MRGERKFLDKNVGYKNHDKCFVILYCYRGFALKISKKGVHLILVILSIKKINERDSNIRLKILESKHSLISF